MLGDAGKEKLEHAQEHFTVATPAALPQPVVNERFLPLGPTTPMPISITEQELCQKLDAEAEQEAAAQEEERRELAEASALDAKRAPEELAPKKVTPSVDVARISLSTRAASLKSLVEKTLKDMSAEVDEYTAFAKESFATEDSDTKTKWEYVINVMKETMNGTKGFSKELSAFLDELLEKAKPATSANMQELDNSLKEKEKEVKDSLGQTKKAVRTFSANIMKQEKSDTKANKNLAASSKGMDIPDIGISVSSTSLEQVFFNARLSDAVKQGLNFADGPETVPVDQAAKFQVPEDALSTARDQEASLKSAQKALDKHMKNHDLSYANMVLANHAKAFQVMASLELPEGATARKVFPPSCQSWGKNIFAPQGFKVTSGYEYIGALPNCVGEGRFLIKGKEWWAGLPYDAVPGDDYASKNEGLKTTRWPGI